VIRITGNKERLSGKYDGMKDHRMVMSSVVSAMGADGKIIVTDIEAVNKSYPEFFGDLIKIGGKFDVEVDG
ncbi:MAG: 3-phosphoshikimate 1-carboxyvinyltransferase, partial [Clostridia bacterium]|nr:3-phosphoshikimate 1-carboxyvinyltransferase [Clostridia bacterium]